MTSPQKRINKSGSVSYRVHFRRKGLKFLSVTFSTIEEAEEFIKNKEKEFCLDNDNFKFDRLRHNREREFSN